MTNALPESAGEIKDGRVRGSLGWRRRADRTASFERGHIRMKTKFAAIGIRLRKWILPRNYEIENLIILGASLIQFCEHFFSGIISVPCGIPHHHRCVIFALYRLLACPVTMGDVRHLLPIKR